MKARLHYYLQNIKCLIGGRFHAWEKSPLKMVGQQCKHCAEIEKLDEPQ